MKTLSKNTLAAAVIAGSAGLAMALPAHADMYRSSTGGLYAGANYSFLTLDDGTVDADVGMLSAKVGGLLTPYFGLEARGGFGVSDDRVAGVDVELTSLFGGYATLNLANESPATPYLIFGMTRYEFEFSGPGGSLKDDDSDFSYGVGVDFALTRDLSANLEYMRYGEKDGIELSGIGLGLNVRF